jgi:hypothetical protein
MREHEVLVFGTRRVAGIAGLFVNRLGVNEISKSPAARRGIFF